MTQDRVKGTIIEYTELIGESVNSKMFTYTADGQKYILKVLKDEYPDPDRIFQFNNELRNTVDLDVKGIRRALRTDKIEGKYALVLEYVEGIALHEYISKERIGLLDTLKIVRSVASTLSELHHHNLIHRDLTTDNILHNPETGETRLIDFGYSTFIDLKTTLQGNPDLIQGTLEYISPEQTGRMNRKVDFRSDLYSLGVIFYEMVAFTKPFISDDPLELIHKHIAVSPIPPDHINHKLPKIISDIIMSLLSKNAEDRYQSAIGLYKDLDNYISQFEDKEIVQNFDLSLKDLTGQFYIPEKLYGREKELALLISSFDQLSKPWVETIMVSGSSGVGKSALVNEIIRSASKKAGYFVKGKFDQYQKGIPYHGFIEPFEELCNYILTEEAGRFNSYKNSINTALEDYGQIIIDLIPSLELIIGEQPKVQRLESLENLYRFNRIFLKFIAALANEGYPIVIFIDDLQWADPASLNLLHTLIVESKIANLLIIGAYRSNEVTDKHPLSGILSKAKEETEHLFEITLDPLSLEHVSHLISDTLNTESSKVEELVQFVYSKTRGNAFYMKELFKSIYEEGLLSFDSKDMSWKFEMEAIKQKGFSDNVVEFMADLIVKLPANTIDVLKNAACVGSLFDTNILSTLLNIDESEIYLRLRPAIKEELIIPLERTFEHATIIQEANLEGGYQYSFSHDRIQQAAYSLLSDEDQKATHLQIGRHLRQLLDNNTASVFDIANQLNKAITLIITQEERIDLAKINIEAASKARDSIAYQAAVSHLEVAELLLGEDAWELHFDTAYELQKMLGELSYLVGEFDRSEKIIQRCLDKAKSDVEKADLYYFLILRKTHSSLYTEAIDAARKGLNLLGFRFPEKTDQNLSDLIQEYFDFLNTYFAESTVLSIADKAELTGEHQLATIRLLDNLSMATYVGAEHELWTLQALMKGKFAIVNGISPETAYAFAELGLIYSLYQNYDLGFECGKLSKKLAEKFAARSLGHKGRSFHLIANYIYPWHHHLNEINDLNEEGFNDCMNSGELIFAGYINFHEYYSHFYTGVKTLEDINEEIIFGIQFNKKIKHDLSWDALIALQMCINNLLGNTKDILDVASDEYNEDKFIEFCNKKNDFYGIACYYNYKSMLLYLYGAYNEADQYFDKLTEFIPPLIGSAMHYSTYLFYLTLNKLALYDTMSEEDQKISLDIIDQNIDIFNKWSIPGPENMLHKLYLLQAEKARILNNFFEAQELYHKSILAAQEGHFIQNEALAYERAGLFWEERKNMFYAKPHLKAAEHGYRLWGAKRKSSELRESYPNIFVDPDFSTISHISHSGANSIKNFDISALLNISRSLSSEINIEELLKKLMQVLIQSAGADKIVLITNFQDSWVVESHYEVDLDVPVFERVALDDFEKVAHSLLQYVTRTQKEYFASDVDKDKLLMNDSYVQSEKPKSAAALPLILKNQLKGIIYLENSVASGALSDERIEFLRMLSYQISIALENARLYTDLKSLNQAYQKYVPSGFLNILDRKSIQDLKLGDQIQKNMTVLFSDIRAYTTISEKMTPEDNFEFINNYLSTVAPCIKNNNGFINQIIGDGIMALFDNAENAMVASLDILKGVNIFNEELNRDKGHPIKVGLGLHSGLMMLGIIGYEKRFSTGVISNAVNTASRMEGLTKIFGSSIVISESTLEQIKNLQNYNYRLLGLIQVKGRKQAIKVYEFYDGDPESIVKLKSQYASEYEKGLAHYFNKDFIGCASSFRNILDINPEDVVAKRYLERAAKLLVSGVEEHWTGVETMTSK